MKQKKTLKQKDTGFISVMWNGLILPFLAGKPKSFSGFPKTFPRIVLMCEKAPTVATVGAIFLVLILKELRFSL